jgi:LuxR family transcriptional regulator, maltose regulon positive regulatory protein
MATPRPAGSLDRRTLLHRPRLLDSIPDSSGAWATLISAPAGYGKTIGIRAMASHMAGGGSSAVWIKADPAQPCSLEAALCQALPRVAGAACPSSLDQGLSQCPDPSAAIGLVVDDIDRWPDATDLILRLAARRWPNMTLLAARRERMGAGLARLEVNGELREVGVAQLRFTDEETARFFTDAGLTLDPAMRGEIQRVTEGWPAALQLALPLLSQNIRSRADLIQRLARPTGALGVYLADEMFGRTPAQSRSYVLEAGALGRFSAELLEAAIGCQDGATMIRRLDDAALFLTTDEADDRWRRFHPLVSAFLEASLRAEAPARSQQVHVKAAAWHEARGQLSEAVTHAFAAQDVDEGVRLLDLASGARERIGRWRALTGWTSRLSDAVLDQYPSVRIEAACAHSVLFEFEAARSQLDAVRANAAPLNPRTADELLAADAIYAAFADAPEAALAASELGRRTLQGRDSYVVGCLHLAGGVGWIGRQELPKARAELQSARASYENGRSLFGASMALALTGLTSAIEGHLERALNAWREGEALIRPMETAAAVESIAIGYMPLVLYEQNRLEAVDAFLDRCFASTAEILLPDMVTALYVAAARTAFARGQLDRAAQYLEEAEVAGLRRDWPRLIHVAGSERLNFALRQEDWTEARRLKRAVDSRELGLPRGPRGFDLEGDGLADLRFQAMLSPSRALLSELRAAAVKASAQSQVWRAVRLVVLDAVTREGMGDHAGALRAMNRALDLGAGGGFVRAFIDEGLVAVMLVRELADQEAQAPSRVPLDLSAILAATGEAPPAATGVAAPPEALSRREIEVLQMVSAGLSNRELAGRLAVSENTVKWHLQHVFAKLSVKNRTRAIIVGRQHGLIA